MPEPLAGWIARWESRLAAEGRSSEVVTASMNAVNPVYIPRNHLVEEALATASSGDLGPFQRLLSVVSSPKPATTPLVARTWAMPQAAVITEAA